MIPPAACFRRTLPCLMLVTLLSGTAYAREAGVIHVVLLWLKDSGNAQQRVLLIEATRRLRDIPGVREIRVGEVVPGERDIVDDSFDIGIYFYFDTVDAMQAYLEHPLHRQVVKSAISPLVSRIRVHDFRDAPGTP